MIDALTVVGFGRAQIDVDGLANSDRRDIKHDG